MMDRTHAADWTAHLVMWREWSVMAPLLEKTA